MDRPTSTYDLIARIGHGDDSAFTPLFEKYQKRLALLIHYKLGHELRRLADVEDVLQETFLEAFRDIERFRYEKPGAFLSWLSRIADHVIADAARFHGRQKRRAELVRFRSVGTPDGPDPADSATPSRLLAEKEGLRALIQKLDSLPEDYRRAILLAKVEGLSNAEMAEQLGRSKEAAALLLHRAIKRFRAIQGA
ncbi:MAG: sigma-70 family RNA polymerase sigma factor [Chloracidobacterium sp.]|nr:sigma-70 family RNA polymerase sigma factor [Chloracidobacterium sp.]